MHHRSKTDTTTPLRFIAIASASAVALTLFLAAPAHSAGSGSSSGTTTQPTTDCEEGKNCDDSKLHDERAYQEGASLAQAGHYQRALDILLAADQNDPRVLNYIGYSYRKLGRLGTGISYYGRALEIDPDFVLARNYLGEGFVSIGRIDKAEEQLAEIGLRCGTDCTEYTQLAQVITDARAGVTTEW